MCKILRGKITMKKILPLFILLGLLIFSIQILHANHIIEGIIFSSDITEGVKSTISVGDTPFGVAVNPSTNKIYVCNSNSNSVSVINGSGNFVESTINVGNNPRYLAVNSNTNKIYVANRLSNNTSIIDGSTNSVISTINTGNKPFAVATNTQTNKVYITNEESNDVSVIDGSTNTVIKTISVGQFPQGIASSSKTNKIYVANSSSNTISVIDGQTDSITSTIQNISAPQDITIDEEADRIFVIGSNSSLFVISSSTNAITGTFSIGKNATNVAFQRATGKVYITVNFNGTVEVFDGRNLAPVYIVGAILSPAGIAINPQTHLIYVCDLTGNALKVIEDSLAKENQLTTTSGTSGGITTSSSSGGTGTIIEVEPIDLSSELDGLLSNLINIQNDLKTTSKFARPVASKLKFLTGLLKSAISKSNLTQCKQILNTVNLQKDLIINKLEMKSCSSNKKKQCITEDIVNEFTIRLEESFETLDSFIQTDGNNNGITDLCE